jgi:hypothetical protein
LPKSGQDLGTDVYELWLAGHKQLPLVAEQFAEALQALLRTESYDDAFERPAAFDGGGMGPAGAGFLNVRDALGGILRDSDDNMRLAGEALELTAEEYRFTDEAAERQFRSMRSGLGGGEY